MDHLISATEANQRFSELLRDVAAGETYTVTSHGKPVARMTPVEVDKPSIGFAELVERMRDRPIVVVGPWKREDLYD